MPEAGQIVSNLKPVTKSYDEELGSEVTSRALALTENISVAVETGPFINVCNFEEWELVDQANNFWMQKEHLNARGRTNRFESQARHEEL